MYFPGPASVRALQRPRFVSSVSIVPADSIRETDSLRVPFRWLGRIRGRGSFRARERLQRGVEELDKPWIATANAGIDGLCAAGKADRNRARAGGLRCDVAVADVPVGSGNVPGGGEKDRERLGAGDARRKRDLFYDSSLRRRIEGAAIGSTGENLCGERVAPGDDDDRRAVPGGAGEFARAGDL